MKADRGRWHRSLRKRLLVGTLLWIVLSVLAAGWLLSDLFRSHLENQMAATLALHMNELVAAFGVDERGQADMTAGPADPRLEQPFSGLYWQIDRFSAKQSDSNQIDSNQIDSNQIDSNQIHSNQIDSNQTGPGRTVAPATLRSRSLWDAELAPPSTASGIVSIPGPHGSRLAALIRIITPPEGSGSWRMIVAEDERTLNEAMSRFRRMLALSLGLLAFGLTAAALMQVLIGLRPLGTLRTRLQAVRRGRNARIEGEFPSEIQPLVDEFNAVLQAGDEIIAHARTQAGNLAHALKTPLSVLANAADDDPSPLGRLVSEQVGEARREVDHHLARARAVAAHRRAGQRTEIAPVVDALLRTLTRLHGDRHVRVHTQGVIGGPAFGGEMHDLQEMLGNLLDNAFRWTRAQIWLSLAASAADRLEILVDDDGPGLSAEQRERALRRGVRIDERVPGSGLGLSIVDDLASAYGGSLRLAGSPHGGLRAILTLPAT